MAPKKAADKKPAAAKTTKPAAAKKGRKKTKARAPTAARFRLVRGGLRGTRARPLSTPACVA